MSSREHRKLMNEGNIITITDALILDSPRKGRNMVFNTVTGHHVPCSDWPMDLADDIVALRKRGKHQKFKIINSKIVLIP